MTYSFGGLCPSTTNITIELNPPQDPTVISQLTNSSTPTIQGSAVLNPGDDLEVTVDGMTYKFSSGDISFSGSTWTLIIPGGNAITTDGTYDVDAIITNGGSTIGTDTSSGELIIDTVAPTVDIQNEPAVTNGPYNVTIKFNEDVFGFDVTDVTVGNGSSSNFIKINQNTYTVDITPDGTGDITVDVSSSVAQDEAGNDNSAAATATTLYDNTPPTLSINTVAGDDIINAVEDDSDVPISGTTDAEDGQTVTVVLNGETYTATVSGGTWSVAVPAADAQALSEGTHTITANVNDAAGNPATQASKDIEKDSVAPTLSINTVAGDDIINAVEDDSDVPISGTTDAEDGQTVTVVLNGETYTATVSGGTWSVAVPAADAQALSEGTHTITANVNDAAGNPATQASKDIEKDSVAPTLSINTVAGDDIINAEEDDSDVTISGTTDAEDGQMVTVVLNGETYTATVSGGTWSVAVPAADAQALSEGTHTITANVNDAAGNPATQASKDIEKDSVAPTLSINTVAGDDIINAVEDDSDVPISGTTDAEDGQTVTVVLNGETYTATVSGGTWSVAVPAADAQALSEGTHTITANVNDAAGNPATQASKDIEKDSVAPTLSINTVAGDDIINAVEDDSDVPISGTTDAEDGQTVTVVLNGETYTATVSGGTWSVAVPAADAQALSEGTHTITANVNDAAGNPATQASKDIEKDSVAPTLSINTVAGDDIINAVEEDSDVTISGTTDAEDGQTVTVVLNGETYTATVSGGTWSVAVPAADAQALSEGTHTITANVNDAAGNPATQASKDIEKDSVAPTLSINTVAGDDIINAVEDDSDVPISGTTDAEDGQTVTVVLNGETYTATVSGGTWSVAVPAADAQALSEGTHTITANVNDVAGNPATEASKDIEKDSVAPTLSINTVAGDDIINAVEDDSDVPISGTTDAEDGQMVTVVLNGETYTATVSGGTWSVAVPAADAQALSEGTHTITANVNDAAGNPATQASKDIEKDSVAPTLSINTVAGDDIINAVEEDSDVTISGTTDAEDGQTVTVVLNGETYTATVSGGTWSVAVPAADAQALSEGTHTITANVNDAAGNPATQASKDIEKDSVAPTLSINTVAGDDIINAVEDDSDVPISGTTDAEDGQTVTVVLNGETYTATVSGGTWSVAVPAADAQALSEGTHTITANVNDAAGNPATQASKDIEKDSVAPTLSINTVAGDDIINAEEDDSDVTISGTTDAEDGQMVTVVLNGETYTATVSGGTWSVAVPAADAQALSEGTHTITANVNDAAGNPATQASKDIEKDSVAPTLSINTVAGDDIINAVEDDSDVPISGTTDAEDGQTVTVVLNGETYTATVSGGTWSVAVPAADAQALSEGTHTITANVSDVAGNPATQASKDIEKDSVAPTLSINTVAGDDIINAVEDDSDVPISGTTDAEDGQTVTVVLNGETYTATVSGGTWSVAVPAADAQALSEGTHTITANVNDAAGNPATQASKDIEKDSVAPTLSINTVAGDDIINAVEDDSDVPISGTTNAEDSQTVTVVLNGETYTSTVSGGTWSVAVPAADAQALSEGTHTITANVNDAAGNPATQASKDIVYDSEPPVIPTVNSQTTDDRTPVLTGTAEAGSTVTVEVGGATYVVTADASGNWSIDTEVDSPNSGSFNPDLNGVNEVVVTSTDAAGNSTSDNTTGELIIDVNDPPVVTEEDVNVDEDVTVSGTLVDNVNDPENHNLKFTLLNTSDPATEGTFMLNADGSYTFVPAENFNGTITLTYEVCDDGNPVQCVQESINITVNPVNDVPSASGESITFNEDTIGSGDLSDNVSDVEGDQLTYSVVSGPDPSTEGTLTMNPDGTYAFVPVENFFGTVSFTYRVCDDGTPSKCSEAVVTLEVSAVNDVPTAQNDLSSTDPGVSVKIDVLANDSDIEGDVLNVSSIVSGPVNGSVTINADGTISYTPDPGFDDGTDEFTYEVCDNGNPSQCATATVTISVPRQEFAPTAVDDAVAVNEDESVSGNVLINDSDGNGDALTVNTSPVAGPSNGTLVLNADGTYTYTPDPDFSGTDSFTYEVCDDATPPLCSTATVTITVNEVNDAPAATAETTSTDEDTPVNGSLADNATDLEGNALTFGLVGAPPASEGTVVINSDGTYTFTPAENFVGTTTFIFEVCDDGNPVQCDQETVTITVNAVNDGPDALDDEASVDPGNTVVISVLANDTDLEGDNLTVSSIVSGPANGTVTINADGTISYTPDPGFDNGSDTFTYEVCDDGTPSECSTATVTVTVPEQSFAPDARDDVATVNEDESASGNVLDNDSDGNGDPLTVNTTPVNGPSNGTLVLNTDGTYTYTPDPGFSGTDSFTYEVCDDETPQNCSQATVSITVNAVNDAPVASSETVVTDEDTSFSGTLADNVTDEDSNDLSFSLVTILDPQTEGVFVLNSDGTYEFTPAPDFNGSLTITYEVCDGGNPPQCVTETINITVNPINDPPVAESGSIVVEGLDPQSGSIAELASDADGEMLTFSLVTPPSSGELVLNGDGSYTYSPVPGFSGDVTFTYEVCDTDSPPNCAQNVVTITIVPVDSDGDGVLDADEDIDGDGDPTNDDSDGDGTPDYLDDDDDGDGIPTSGEDINGDGDPTNDDSDGDGIPDYLDEDDDGDGIPTEEEDINGDGDPTNDDSDGDGIPDYLDEDDDGDGIPTEEEDIDGDGDPSNDDSDGDGTPDYQDEDDDGDGIPTEEEDIDGDGDPSNDDSDGNGTPDYLDEDDDGDGIPSEEEDIDGDGDPSNDDSDGDGTPDYQDEDDDGDGLTTEGEDSDGDGDPTNDDCDADGIPNYLDTDSCDTDGGWHQ